MRHTLPNVLGVCYLYCMKSKSKSAKGQKEMTNPATTRQVDYINSLLTQREFSEVIEFATLTSQQASDYINRLLASPRLTTSPATSPRSNISELRVGMYRTQDGEIYRVHESRETGRLYAKHLNLIEMKFEYASGAIYRLTPADRMTLDQARAFGVETGICCVCGAFLTDPRSVANGIGPVCERNV